MRNRVLTYTIYSVGLIYVAVGIVTGLVISSFHGPTLGALAGLGWPIWLLIGLIS
ncbi:MAG: hypothetical protein ACXAEN_26755 [Candidatus Thorarchaeota archaeon]|jgi:hypothetical protein